MGATVVEGLASCPYCKEEEVPSMEHVLWRCIVFDKSRVKSRPEDDWQARMGWSADMMKQASFHKKEWRDTLRQMGNIRKEEIDLRKKWLEEEDKQGEGAGEEGK